MNKEIDTKRLKWLCRRGMLELDILLSPFYENQFRLLSEEKKIQFLEILKFEDNILYSILIKNVAYPNHLDPIIREIKNFYLRCKKKSQK